MIPKIGAHVSTQGGLYKCFENAKRIGAEAVQIFASAPQQWAVRPLSETDIEKFEKAQKESNVGPVFIHASYLVNLASPDEILRMKSVKSLTDSLKISEAIGAQGLIFHIGSGKEAPKEQGIENVTNGVKEVFKNVPGKSQIILENSAGGGHKIGATSEDIGKLLKKINSPRAKICFDTAHAFEAGIIENYTPENIKKLLNEWDTEVGLENIVSLHINDSNTAFGSHHDKHENLGKGFIGLDSFKNLAKEKRLYDKAWLLEVPGLDRLGPDEWNIDVLKSCFS